MNECLYIYARPVSPLRIHTRYSSAFAPIPAGRFGCSLAGKVGPVLNIFPPFMAGALLGFSPPRSGPVVIFDKPLEDLFMYEKFSKLLLRIKLIMMPFNT